MLRWLNPVNAFLSSSLKEVGDEVSLILRARRAIRKRRWSLWPIKEEHVRKFRNRETSRRPDSVFPVTGNGVAFSVANVKLGKRSRNGIEAGCENYYVNVDDTFVLSADAVLFDVFDRALVNVDDLDMWLIHYFVEALLERRSFGAPC